MPNRLCPACAYPLTLSELRCPRCGWQANARTEAWQPHRHAYRPLRPWETILMGLVVCAVMGAGMWVAALWHDAATEASKPAALRAPAAAGDCEERAAELFRRRWNSQGGSGHGRLQFGDGWISLGLDSSWYRLADEEKARFVRDLGEVWEDCRAQADCPDSRAVDAYVYDGERHMVAHWRRGDGVLFVR
jgi:hypothetical protein